MGLPESFFTGYFHASDIKKRVIGEVEYSCPIEPVGALNFAIDSGYTGEIVRIESRPTNNTITLNQAGDQITLTGITSANGYGGLPIIIVDVLFDNLKAHLYIDKTYVGAIDVNGNVSQKLFITGGLHYLKLWNAKVTQDIVMKNYKYFLPEQFYWSFNGEDLGRTRCDITKFVPGYNFSAQAEDLQTGSSVANTFGFSLHNELPGLEGSFSDDQFADRFDPSLGFYNGTSDDRFLQDRFRGSVESTFNNSFETQLVGRVDASYIKRKKDTNSAATANMQLEDVVEKLARTIVTDGLQYEDYKLVDSDNPDNSLLHKLVTEATNLEVQNLVTNGDFSSGATGWTLSGKGLNIIDSYDGNSLSGTGSASQNINTPFSSYYVSLYIRDGAGSVTFGDTTKTYSAGSDFELIQFKARTPDDVSTLTFTNGVIDNVCVSIVSHYGYKEGSFKTLEIVADSYKIIHPWVFVQPGENYWDYLKQISVASAGTYLGADRYGRFVFESGFVNRPAQKVIDLMRSIGAQIADSANNKMKVSGSYIIKDEDVHTVWNTDSANFNKNDLVVKNYWPDPDVNGDYFARYKGID